MIPWVGAAGCRPQGLVVAPQKWWRMAYSRSPHTPLAIHCFEELRIVLGGAKLIQEKFDCGTVVHGVQ